MTVEPIATRLVELSRAEPARGGHSSRNIALARIKKAVVGCEAILLLDLQSATVLEVCGELKDDVRSLLPHVAVELLSAERLRPLSGLLGGVSAKERAQGAELKAPQDVSLMTAHRLFTLHRIRSNSEIVLATVCGEDTILAQLLREVRIAVSHVEDSF